MIAAFGDIEKIERGYATNEIRSIWQLFNQVNELLRGDRRVSWRELPAAVARSVTGLTISIYLILRGGVLPCIA